MTHDSELRIETAARLLAGILANPERYKYIAKLVDNGMSQEDATDSLIARVVATEKERGT